MHKEGLPASERSFLSGNEDPDSVGEEVAVHRFEEPKTEDEVEDETYS